MGLARAESEPGSELDQLLTTLERDLYVLMAEATTDPSNRRKLMAGTTLVTAEMVAGLEAHIDDLKDRFEMPTDFVVPGANRASAALDLARTVVRRAERLEVASPTEGSLVRPVPEPPLRPVVGHGPLDRGRPPPAGAHHPPALGGRSGRGPTRPERPRPRPRSHRPITRSILMDIEVATLDALPDGLVALGVPVVTGDGGPQLASDPGTLAGVAMPRTLDAVWCKRHGFAGKVGQTLALRAAMPTGASDDAGEPEADVILVGVGDLTLHDGGAASESLRRAAAAYVRAVGPGSVAALLLPAEPGVPDAQAASAVAEGAALAAYRYDDFRTGEQPEPLDRLVVVPAPSSDPSSVAAGLQWGARLAESVSLARDLVNEPPSSLTPSAFADTFVQRFAGVDELTVEVWDEDRIVAEKLGGLLGVARGSTQPPRLVTVDYTPSDPIEIDGRVPHLALVGKGITFDSGGLSLKTATGMETMKTDMGGAAAVLGAVDAAAALGSRIRITAITPLTENMPGGSAIKPGDVLTTRSGKTIEVLNTDAEGRLVLSDGLTLATESGPDAVIDLATLTGAAVVALGKEIAGLLGNSEALIDEVRRAGDRAGEPNWPLPLPDDYRSHIDSEVADMRNVGRPGQAGSIAAAMLLREFVGPVPWAHLDIAGPARSDESSRYLAKGGTGFGVRTLVALVTSEEFARTLVALDGD